MYNRKLSVDFVVEAMGAVSSPDLDERRNHDVCHNKYELRKQLDWELKALS